MRIPGDTLFAFGMVVFCWFLLGLVTGHPFADIGFVDEGSWEITAEQALVDKADKINRTGRS
jgi:hypothetical protein